MAKKPTVFISHASEDEPIGRAWMALLRSIPGTHHIPYLAEDMRRGIQSSEKWAESIDRALDDATITIALLTPSSNNRPWVLWESGVAYGRNKKFIPLYCYLKFDKVNPVLKQFQPADVMTKAGALAVCKQHFMSETLEGVEKQLFDAALDQYVEVVRQHKVVAETAGLFVDHFHNHARAKQLDGYWLADWDVYGENGKPERYERDELSVWTTDDRIRAVGFNTKTGIDRMGTIARFYPMEGIVSSSGWVALSFWSAGPIQYCGAILLCDDGTGVMFNGTWEGFSSPVLGAQASLKKGVVTLRRVLKTDVDPIIEAMQKNGGQITAAEVAVARGIDEEMATRLLNHLVITDEAQKNEDGRWKLAADS